MKAEYEIKAVIIKTAYKWAELGAPSLSSDEEVNEAWDNAREDDRVSDCIQDAKNDFRSAFSHRTEVKCDFSRHYDSESVAVQLDNGKWVGYTYWSGGGKHGEPGAIDWIEDAYFLKATPKVITTYEFEKEQENDSV